MFANQREALVPKVGVMPPTAAIKLKRAHSVLPRHSEQIHKHLRGIHDGRKGLSLTIVETMYQTGRDLGRGYRETSENALAKLYREGDGACD